MLEVLCTHNQIERLIRETELVSVHHSKQVRWVSFGGETNRRPRNVDTGNGICCFSQVSSSITSSASDIQNIPTRGPLRNETVHLEMVLKIVIRKVGIDPLTRLPVSRPDEIRGFRVCFMKD